MKKKAIMIIAIMIIISLTLIGKEKSGETYVIIIASGEFEQSKTITPLPSALKDAQKLIEQILLMEIAIEKNIKYYKNPTYAQINVAFLDIARYTKENDKIIIYYGGHGFTGKEDNNLYIVPKDYQEDFKEYTSYNLIKITQQHKSKSVYQQHIQRRNTIYNKLIRRNI